MFVLILLYLLQHEFFLALEMSTKYFTDLWRLFQVSVQFSYVYCFAITMYKKNKKV